MIFFSVSALEKAPVNKSDTLPGEFLDLLPGDSFQPVGDVFYDLTASLVSGGVLLSGTISAQVSAVCGRCLKDVVMTLKEDNLHLFFELVEGQEILEVDEDVRAELLLLLPMNPLCTSECRGLCPECGCNLNEISCSCNHDSGASAVSPWSALDSLNL